MNKELMEIGPNGADFGKYLRDEGMAIVEENSGQWKEIVKPKIDFWFESLPVGNLFVGEDIRLEMETLGVGEPHHHNAWSAVIGGKIRYWLRIKRIEVYGLQAGKDPKAHARRMITYRKML